MNNSTIASVVAAAALLVACSDDDSVPAGLTNSTFAQNTNGWIVEDDPQTATVAWSSLDADGASGSGSALVTNTSQGPSNGTGIVQCVRSITAGADYTFGGKLLFPAGQARTGNSAIGLRWHAGAGCTGAVLGDQPRLEVYVPGPLWVTLISEQLVAPAGAVSADFVAYTSKVEAGGQLIGNFDDLFIESGSASLLLGP